MLSPAFPAVLEIGLLLGSLGAEARSVPSAAPRRSPPLPSSFAESLPIPQVKKPLASYANPRTGVPIDFYQLRVRDFRRRFYPNSPNGRAIGYDGVFPGPTFRVERGRETVVRVVNDANRTVNLHLHGSYTRSPWDGWAKDGIRKGEYKDYYYPNQASSRTLWYHDHSLSSNTMNMYQGLVGMYQIVDSKTETPRGIPTEPRYDIPIMFTSHYFTASGRLTDESRERASVYGDTWLANGAIRPHLDVEPRRYRFRVLNAAVSRTLNMTLEVERGPVVDMAVVAGDGGLRPFPVATKSLVAGMGERWEIVVDFAPYAGKRILARATNMWSDKEYRDSDKIMQFRVGRTVSSHAGDEPLPPRFAANSTRFPSDRISATRYFSLDSHMDMMWGINGLHMDDPMKRVLMRPPLGTIEKYVLKSAGMGMAMGMMGDGQAASQEPVDAGEQSAQKGSEEDGAGMGMMGGGMMGGGMMGGMMGSGGHHGHMSAAKTKTKRGLGEVGDLLKVKKEPKKASSGATGRLKRRQMMGMMGGSSGWTHAMHFHLVDLQIISRRKDDPSKPDGRSSLEPYEKDAVKDIVLFGSNEVVEILLKFQPYPGLYMWHCHNAVHEDGGMMATMNVTRLRNLGYGLDDTRLEDPVDQRFRARVYAGTDIEDIKTRVLPAFAKLGAYPDGEKLAALEERYWSGRGYRT